MGKSVILSDHVCPDPPAAHPGPAMPQAAALARRSATMRQPRSIRFHLSLVFIFFFLLIFFLGMLSIARLRDFNKISADIADQWLPNTRALGDLNNYTSDFRAAEGTMLLSQDTTEREAIER